MISLKIGTRPSVLALRQVEEIQTLLPQIIFDIVPIETKGDKDRSTPLTMMENTDFFTCEIEQALLRRDIDAAVHSAKDLEGIIHPQLVIAAMTASVSRFDCLVSPSHYTLDSLPLGSRVGTSSRNRKEAVTRYRDDLVVMDIRGNVDERLTLLDRGNFDAIVTAHAALIRLGFEHRISQFIPFHIIEPHPLQGKLAVQISKDRYDLQKIFRRTDGTQTRKSIYCGSRAG